MTKQIDGWQPKALVAMSGGVDSSVAAYLASRDHTLCAGVTMKLFDLDKGMEDQTPKSCCSLSDVNDARDVAFHLGIPHYVLNFKDEFARTVIDKFIRVYEEGGTPNPCIDCNRYVKFNTLLFRARQLEFDYLVTGHYACIEKSGTRWLLKKGRDAHKDQSYVLAMMTQEQLEHTVFPLGNMTKDEVRELATELGFINARKHDSQDICFVPDGDYGRFLEKWIGKHYAEGNILDVRGEVIGQHRGYVRYTIGQRRGLGISSAERLFVCKKSAQDNTVTLGPESTLYSKSMLINDLNFIACEKLSAPLRLTVKTRYMQREEPARVEQRDVTTLYVEFDEPQRAITAGQTAVLYDSDIVIGAGTIMAHENTSGGGSKNRPELY
ncbi:MAG: tRNA 2-thiouridine(34) synthase MnmA [Spirochaetaceae bacterium]|jgi:tRNA-specific 2-thiouridylase|nr:tRNA 2-thiouridine(34) synthase MnmA [Spirochaetaceae bacterium]